MNRGDWTKYCLHASWGVHVIPREFYPYISFTIYNCFLKNSMINTNEEDREGMHHKRFWWLRIPESKTHVKRNECIKIHTYGWDDKLIHDGPKIDIAHYP